MLTQNNTLIDSSTEIAKGGRAGCHGTQCKKEGTKIAKGELRQGVQVTIKEHTSFLWRHW